MVNNHHHHHQTTAELKKPSPFDVANNSNVNLTGSLMSASTTIHDTTRMPTTSNDSNTSSSSSATVSHLSSSSLSSSSNAQNYHHHPHPRFTAAFGSFEDDQNRRSPSFSNV